MANKSLEAFTGAEDVDITGRTPDGGELALAVGTWDRAGGSPGAGTFDLLATSMLAGPPGVSGNNVASLNVPLPDAPPIGSFLCVQVYTRDSTARNPTTPTDWVEVASASGAGKVVLYGRVSDGTEGASLTVSFTGGGVAGCDQLGFSFAIVDADPSPIGQVGSASSWLSADSLGPVTGLTPSQANSVVLLCAAKQNDFAGTSPPATAAGWALAGFRESTAGSDAGMVMLWQDQVGGPTVVGNATITDTGAADSAGAGVGFMVEIKRIGSGTSSCRHRTPSGLIDWNHYVVKDIPDLGGAGTSDYMVEGTFTFVNDSAIFVGVLARHNDDVTETGYEWNLIPPLSGSPGSAFAELYHIWDGAYSILRSVNIPSIAFGVPFKLRLCVTGPDFAVEFKCYVDDVRIIPDDGTLDPLGNFIHTPPSGQEISGGWPGACLNDGTASRSGTSIKFSRLRIAEFCDDTEIPCEGDDDNPYPWDPPPPGPLPVPPDLWGRQIGAWRDAPVPSPDTDQVQGTGVGDSRIGRAIAVHASGRWRAPAIGSDQLPDPNHPLPPHYDPCNLLPELPPGDVEPIPLTSRFFGISKVPVSVCGPIFNGTKEAIGGWTPATLAACVSKGVTLITAQGGNTEAFMVGNSWDRDQFVAETVNRVGPRLSALQAGTLNGSHFGYSIADDIFGGHFWPPSGIPTDDLTWIFGQLHALLPNIRLGVRAKPSQLPDVGADFYSAQYVYRPNQSAFAFGATEYAIAASRNAFVCLDLNYVHGGDGSSGIIFVDGTLWSGNYECSAAEVLAYLTGMIDGAVSVDPNAPWLAGMLGYKYYPPFLTRPGMVDGLVGGRNHLAGVPALP